jgi:hypothetical protein
MATIKKAQSGSRVPNVEKVKEWGIKNQPYTKKAVRKVNNGKWIYQNVGVIVKRDNPLKKPTGTYTTNRAERIYNKYNKNK